MGRRVTATSTCGEVNGQPIREMYCTITGASPYTPYNQYTYTMVDERRSRYREMRAEAGSFIQGGQNCDYCEANTSSAHPASNMVDGSPLWWQSPPLSRGMGYSEVNITFELEQPFYVSYVWVQMANSPRPGTWILERSADFGVNWHPWQYFATSPAECSRVFGVASLRPITEDDDVVCSHDFSSIQPMDNGEIMINLIEGRPSKSNFGGSEKLQNFVSATNVRLRLLRPKTLQGHLMDLHGTQDQTPDVTVTRRYYYGIKEVYMVGRCICNGHSDHCDPLDPSRPLLWICRCEHNTEGESCQRCKPGFEQKRWRQSHESDQFVCEQCNCHGHSTECVFEEELERQRKSLDIHGQFAGGGRCLNCEHNTRGINCNECVERFYRPAGKSWNDLDACQPCVCDPLKHGGNCAEETGQCECLPQFVGAPECNQCAPGYFHPPECRPCECNVNGTVDRQCLPDSPNGQCPCREGFTGQFCEQCAPGFTNISAGCTPCQCDQFGATSGECDLKSGQCQCKSSFGGVRCERCAKGYFREKETNDCVYCDCDPSGTVEDVCDDASGQCLCKPGFAGRRCDRCDDNFFGYPSCRDCICNERGSKSAGCDQVTGECPCFANFTGRTCDKCSAGYYRFPDCLACDCAPAGSKGLTCDPEGQCYCKPNFGGKHCERCLPNFFNWPICEECNCHPAGVVPEFAGCDKVPPGELCTCRANVQGRTCSSCKPNHWDLQTHHPTGCIDCGCNMSGTLSLSNDCHLESGQCQCKRFVGGQKCDQCLEGFFKLLSDSHVGCQPCNCDVGGAIGTACNQETGQCRCRPRIGGVKCDQPIQDHYFPTLWHNRYEAEDGHLPDGKNVRFAIDKNDFPDFSWRGFVVFSTIQEQIHIDVTIRKSAMYKLLIHYRNPTEVDVELGAKFVPLQTQTADSDQSAKVALPPSGAEPRSDFVQSKPEQRPFVLNPGRWQLQLTAQKRLFLDYVVLIPTEYYQGSQLTEHIFAPCQPGQTHNCVELRYPPAPFKATVQAETAIQKFEELAPGSTDRVKAILSISPDTLLPKSVGQGALVHTEDQSKDIRVGISVPEDGIYLLAVDYHSQEPNTVPIRVHVEQAPKQQPGEEEQEPKTAEKALLVPAASTRSGDGFLLINHCDYDFFCRELLSTGGRPAMMQLRKSPPDAFVTLSVQPGRKFSLGAISLVKEEEWNRDLLQQKAHCVRKEGKCVAQQFPQPPKSIRTEAESGRNINSSISADKLPFLVSGEPAEIRVMSLDSVHSTLDIEGVVDSPGNYIFVVHYYSPENPPIQTDVMVQNERFADVKFHYCPSTSGCRTTVVDRHTGLQQFHIDDKYFLTFYAKEKQQHAPIYIDYVLPVPFESFSDSVLRPLPLALAEEYVEECAAQNFWNRPENVSDYCRSKIFSVTAEFVGAAMACDCNPQGSQDFACEKYGGQCKCKPNVIGRSCERCAPGFYNFPDCIRCRCGTNYQCDERTGQCFCPRYVEGLACDRCVQYAYGYDPLIGCQLCGCSVNGSVGEQQQLCDSTTGQCLCKENVGGRRCEKCLPGYWAFPECRDCDCNQSGTEDQVCDERTSRCLCKKNALAGTRCDQCRPGTFDLRKSDPDGCSECFCFHITERCRSSNWPIRGLRVADNDWRVDDPSGSVSVDFDQQRGGGGGRIVYDAFSSSTSEAAASSSPPQSVYFEVDLQPGVDYTRMYGLHLSFAISSFPSVEHPRTNQKADIKLIGGSNMLEHWATEQPRNASQRFNVVVTLLPEYWLGAQGEPATRERLMLTLLRLQRVQIKASYYEQPRRAILEHFQLEMADSGAPTADENGVHRPLASSVEVCECPPPNAGPSCQECAPGFYRLPVKSGQLLGSCVPCQCFGHSGSCDPVTGVCLQCQHNTEGEHCERCREGFYGNASTGSAAACLRCPCPHPSESNNFAKACSVSELGILERCECREGYTGDRCEMCAAGFFGTPMMPNGGCERCNCSGNNDLKNPGACHPQTGDCALCERNTDGRHCEQCAQWFWGDAVQTKNCTPCECHQCGSAVCEHRSGQCKCHPLVEGARCERCAENAWGLDSCRGCQPCNCGLAASNSQCDLKTGQCACMPGAAGQFCDRCEHGFWRYSPQGCQKCDCEADLSLGTVCDVRTGQCHCQEGATGPRCDKCLQNYLRVPAYGCRLCDECVYALAQETDQMDTRVSHLRALLSNVSSETLTGARLNRVQKQITELEPQLERVVAPNSAEAEEISTQIVPKAKALKESASAAAIRAQRTTEQLSALDKRLDESYGQLGEIRSNAQQLLEMTQISVQRIETLRRRFETQAPLEMNREELRVESERKLQTIRGIDEGHAGTMAQAEERLLNVSGTRERIATVKGRSEEFGRGVVEQRERLERLDEWRRAFEEELQTVNATLAAVKKNLDSRSQFTLRSMIEGIEKDNRALDSNMADQQANLGNVTQLLEQFKVERARIEQLLGELSELRAQLPSSATKNDGEGGGVRARRETLVGILDRGTQLKLRQKVAQLETEAQHVVGIFDAARLEANRTMEAANVHKEVADAFKSAREQLAEARKQMRDADEEMRSRNASAKGARAKSKALKEQSNLLDADSLREVKGRSEAVASREQQLMPALGRIRDELAAIKRQPIKPGDGRQPLIEADTIREQADQAQQKLAPLEKDYEEMRPKMEDADRRVRQLMDSNGGAAEETATARDQIEQVIKEMPSLKAEWEDSRRRLDQTTAKVKEARSRLTLLKEKVLLARDKANRVKLGAHFERGSFLELPLPQASDNFATITDARFFFRTRERNALLLMLGSSNAQLSGEFLAVELEHERPKLTLNLGQKSAGIVQLSTPVNDNQWRELVVQRRGRRATLLLSKPGGGGNGDKTAEEKSVELSGPKSVLNLFDDSRRLFIGGIPPDFQLPTALQQRHFTGDMDKLRVNGELIGFWNSEKAHGISGAEMRQLPDVERSAEQEVTFNGRGYLQMDVGAWNPRKRTAIMLTFRSYSPDGLLFFVGKDRDQLVLELVGGRVSLLFDLGSGPAKLVSSAERYNDGKWHLVEVDRVEKAAKLKVDSTDFVEGESPGSLFEMSVSDSFFLGGLPASIETTRFSVQPFRGCIRNLKLDSEYISLARPRASKGVQSSCVNQEVRVGTLLSERSFAQFTGLSLDGKLELCFRFRPAATFSSSSSSFSSLSFSPPQQPQQIHLLSVMVNNDQEELLRVHIEGGALAIRPNGDDTGLMRAELGQRRLAGGWHHLCVLRDSQTIRAFVDDVLEDQRSAPIEGVDLLNSKDVLLGFGRLESTPSFVGCIGDILLGSRLLSLAESDSNELTLSGCSSALGSEEGAAEGEEGEKSGGGSEHLVDATAEQQRLSKEERAGDARAGGGLAATSTVLEAKPLPSPAKVRPDGVCALPLTPHGEREDSSGLRFGLSPNARLEFFDVDAALSAPDFEFSVELRATAANGILMFAADERHSQFVVLYLLDGRPVFASKSGAGAHEQLTIMSTRSLLDDEWHTLRVQREGAASALYVNGQLEVQNRSNNTIVNNQQENEEEEGEKNKENKQQQKHSSSSALLSLQSPLFVGGLPLELVPFAARLLPGVRAEFGGCLRAFSLNSNLLDVSSSSTARTFGTVECAQFMEPGMFFGKEGGYAILDRQLEVGTSFSLELELKPRTKNAVLVSVGVLEFMSLQLLNGTVKFSVDNGAGVESVIYEPAAGSSSLCDGHWHQLKVYRKKKLLTLNVDGKSNLKVLKKSATETSNRDPLYLGGVPRDVKLKGLDTQEPYIGCVRVLSLGKKNRRRRSVPEEYAQKLELFGSVERNSCPLN